VKEFERNGVKLSPSKRKEMEKLKCHIDELNLNYLQNLNDFTKFLLLNEDELENKLESSIPSKSTISNPWKVQIIFAYCMLELKFE
jgi:Zn-dependent oligopeptidase